MSFSMVLIHNPHFATPRPPPPPPPPPNTIIFTISSSSSSSSFRPKPSSSSWSSSFSSTNRILPNNQPKPIIKTQTLAARDTIINFGKHKGKMLGTLPSSYLKWISNNLRAGDSEYWAKLSDEVLKDDVYKDRTEWEFAENILHGSNETLKSLTLAKKNRGGEANSVSMLLEISERFGWDNEDKIGWSKVNFEFLGTSKGGRIPRLNDERVEMVRREMINKEEEEDGSGLRKRERRERMRQRDDVKTVNKSEEKGILGKVDDIEKKVKVLDHHNPFPGRESLLKKVMNKRRAH